MYVPPMPATTAWPAYHARPAVPPTTGGAGPDYGFSAASDMMGNPYGYGGMRR